MLPRITIRCSRQRSAAVLALTLLTACARERSVTPSVPGAPRVPSEQPSPLVPDADAAAGTAAPEDQIREYLSLANGQATGAEYEAFIAAHTSLLAASADPYGPTLMWVLAFGHEEAALALIDAGAAVPSDALGLAAQGGLDALVQALLARGSSPRDADDWGYTPLHHAAEYGHSGTIRLLLAAKAAPSPRESKDGLTPLHLAVIGRHLDAMAVLIAAGADLDARDDEGQTPLHWAAFAYVPQPKHLYRKGSAPHTTVLIDPGPAKGISFLLDAGARIDAVDDAGNTPLHTAARLGAVRAVETLLRYGAETEVRNQQGETPLSIAKARKREEIVKMLGGGN